MTTSEQVPIGTSGNTSGASWSAIFSGISIAIAVYLLLLILGAGIGFTALSPDYIDNYAVETIGVATVFWIILTQLISAGGGGYVAGRLAPTKRADQSYFYHGAHGLVVWALTSIALAMLLGTTAGSILSGGSSVVAAMGKEVIAGAAYLEGIDDGNGTEHKYSLFNSEEGGKRERSNLRNTDDIIGYAIDVMFRPWPQPQSESGEQNRSPSQSKLTADERSMQRKEIVRIFVSALQQGQMSSADKNYIAHLVSERTGMSHNEALRRVNETFEQVDSAMGRAAGDAKKAIDNARHATAVTALWTFATLLAGALVAAAAASCGGGWRRQIVLPEDEPTR